MKTKHESSLLKELNRTYGDCFELVEEYVSLNGVIGAYRFVNSLFSDGDIQIYVQTDETHYVANFNKYAEESALECLHALARFGLAEKIERE